ncbi:hypothetical protein NBRC111894_1475 [Sporolactobacillus inulinus]|uniref:Uncharacterized protein n=1 Tax=Sporolactobacillus inulinus TaxID=2078 RepID=A0A4Y1ZAH9_9BACL|nr:hypothetical protein NBRC111894_1475 [Sporolactobacillus inulinus]
MDQFEKLQRVFEAMLLLNLSPRSSFSRFVLRHQDGLVS